MSQGPRGGVAETEQDRNPCADGDGARRATLRILLIDGTRPARMMERLGLVLAGGAEVVEVAGGEEGLAVARRALPDAILLDVNMRGMSGPETLLALRSDPRTAGIPVILLAA